MPDHAVPQEGSTPDVLRKELADIGGQIERAIKGNLAQQGAMPVVAQTADPAVQLLCQQINALLGIARWASAEAEAAAARRAADLQQAQTLSDQAAEAKVQLMTNMSHEVRSPMSTLLDANTTLLETTLDPNQRELAEAVQDSARVLWRVVNDVLNAAQLASGRSGLMLDLADFDLHDLLARAIRAQAHAARSKNVELTLDVDAGVPRMAHGDAGRLRQVLVNLLGNAVKFTEAGKVAVGARTITDGLRVEIQDTGVGIPPQAIARLFRKFEQADPSVARRYGGTGLGLAISKELVELMGGRIDFRSTVGVGTTFWFEVKLGRAFDAAELSAVQAQLP